MSRLRAQTGPAISLFPFLAVLLCTMGSLLVLLVIFSRSAQNADTAAAATATAAAAEELLLAREELAWRIDQLAGVKARTEDDLARVRMQLAGIEEHARGLADEFDALEQTAAALEAGAEEPADGESIAELEQRLAAAEAELAEARDEAAERPPAYAVVPFEGEAGTHRRPLYIECCIDGVFLQPEGIRLGPADFEGPPGPGNPLASGLRAAREYLAQQPGESGDPGVQPYPLLLVRPSGVMAYYAARESLQSWGSDFGYQFVDEEWELAYPPADPRLADVESRAIAEARRRLEWLAQVRPPKRTRPAVQYRAATTRGGVVASGGPSVLGDQSQWDWTEEQAAAAARPGRGFQAGDARDGAGSGGGDAILGGGGGGESAGEQWSQAGGGGPGAMGAGGVGSGIGDRYRGPSKFYGGGGTAGEGMEGQLGDGAAAAGGVGEGLAQSGFDGTGDGRGEGDGGGEGSDGMPGGSGTGAGSGAGGGPGGSGSADALAAASADGSTGGGAGGSSGQGGSQASGQGGGGGNISNSLPGMPQGASASAGAAGDAEGCSGGSCSLAGRRGSNWASLATQDRPIPLTRPIRLECAASEFRILGAGGRVERRVRIDGITAAAIDPLVREIHATVGAWGMAGDRMYWKPELVLSATPDGTGRRDDLEQLLADSGLETRRSGTGEQVRRLPPVHRTGGMFRSR